MLPSLPLNRFRQAGNVTDMGANAALRQSPEEYHKFIDFSPILMKISKLLTSRRGDVVCAKISPSGENHVDISKKWRFFDTLLKILGKLNYKIRCNPKHAIAIKTAACPQNV